MENSENASGDEPLTPDKIRKLFSKMGRPATRPTVVMLPDMVNARRSWTERLFSWPWRPHIATKSILNAALPAPGMIYLDSKRNVYYCRAADYMEVRKRVNERALSPREMLQNPERYSAEIRGYLEGIG